MHGPRLAIKERTMRRRLQSRRDISASSALLACTFVCLIYSPRRVLGLGREQNADVNAGAMADDSLAVLLRTHTGMSDVDDLLAVCAGLADEDCATYLQAFISDADTADAVAAQIVAARSNQALT